MVLFSEQRTILDHEHADGLLFVRQRAMTLQCPLQVELRPQRLRAGAFSIYQMSCFASTSIANLLLCLCYTTKNIGCYEQVEYREAHPNPTDDG